MINALACTFTLEAIMTRILPTAWTTLHMAAAGLAAWLLCNTDALGGIPPLFFH